ncbi:hypothetical protein NL676_007221 [Syzygium grande]|nr:hypothetical protein NL676_007221 [Syzygium grande]
MGGGSSRRATTASWLRGAGTATRDKRQGDGQGKDRHDKHGSKLLLARRRGRKQLSRGGDRISGSVGDRVEWDTARKTP